jgi:hypothetical protein
LCEEQEKTLNKRWEVMAKTPAATTSNCFLVLSEISDNIYQSERHNPQPVSEVE